jgi:hypothetical protein
MSADGLPSFPIHGPSQRDRLLCCWQDDAIIDEHGTNLGQPDNIGEVMCILMDHHAILLTADNLAGFEEEAMRCGWNINRVADDDNISGPPKIMQLSMRHGKNIGVICHAKAILDGEDRDISVSDLQAIRQLCDHLGIKAKATIAAISIETMRAHLPRHAINTLPAGMHDDIYQWRRFPRAENIQPGTFFDIHEYDLTSAFAAQLAAGVPNGAAIKTGSETFLERNPFALAHIRWRFTGDIQTSPRLLRRDREDNVELGDWHKCLIYWNIAIMARSLGYDIELDPDYRWPAIVWRETSNAFAPWVSWINERLATAPNERTQALIKLVRNAGIGRFAMSRLEWKATTDPHKVMSDPEIRQWSKTARGIPFVRLSDDNHIAYYKAPGRTSDTALLHIALWCWQQTDFEVWRIVEANPQAEALAVYVDNVIFRHKLKVRPMGWHYKQLRGQHVIDDMRNIHGETVHRHPGKKREVA